jgi:hypothetical protein
MSKPMDGLGIDELKVRLRAAEAALGAVRYQGDGNRWFGRRDGTLGGGMIGAALIEYEAAYGQVEEIEDSEAVRLAERGGAR